MRQVNHFQKILLKTIKNLWGDIDQETQYKKAQHYLNQAHHNIKGIKP